MSQLIRKFLTYSIFTIMLGACTFQSSAVRIKQTPQHLTVSSKKLPTISNAKAEDGCAFSGTWKLIFDGLVRASINGWITFQVVPKTDKDGGKKSEIRSVIEWDLYQGRITRLHETASFYVHYLGAQPFRSFESDAYMLLKDGKFSKVPVTFDLHDNGLSMTFSYFTPAYKVWVVGVAEKFRAAKCGQAEPYIDEVKKGLEAKSGIRLPPDAS